MSNRNQTKVGQFKFFQACEALRNYREEIQNTCKTREEVCRFIGGKIGIALPLSTYLQVVEATGISLAFAKKKLKGNESTNNRRIVIKSITDLYENLGVNVSEDLAGLFSRAFGRPYRPPVPVTAVKDPATVPNGQRV